MKSKLQMLLALVILTISGMCHIAMAKQYEPFKQSSPDQQEAGPQYVREDGEYCDPEVIRASILYDLEHNSEGIEGAVFEPEDMQSFIEYMMGDNYSRIKEFAYLVDRIKLQSIVDGYKYPHINCITLVYRDNPPWGIVCSHALTTAGWIDLPPQPIIMQNW